MQTNVTLLSGQNFLLQILGQRIENIDVPVAEKNFRLADFVICNHGILQALDTLLHAT
jgi:hypothetical protein